MSYEEIIEDSTRRIINGESYGKVFDTLSWYAIDGVISHEELQNAKINISKEITKYLENRDAEKIDNAMKKDGLIHIYLNMKEPERNWCEVFKNFQNKEQYLNWLNSIVNDDYVAIANIKVL